jgi:hypothetical protein
MWYADAKSNESYDAAMSKMREQRKANALSDQADQAFYNAAEEAEKRANSKRGKGMEIRGTTVAAFLQELEDVYVDAVASGNGKEFLLNLFDNMEDWKRKLGDTNTEAKTLASEMFDPLQRTQSQVHPRPGEHQRRGCRFPKGVPQELPERTITPQDEECHR